MKFSRDGKFIYVLNELDLSLSVFAYNAGRGHHGTIANHRDDPEGGD